MSLNTLNLKQKQGGRVIKQADRSSTFKFALQDSNGALINLDGQSASISLHNPNSRRYWETTASVKNSEVEFKLPGNLVNDDYILEISCNGYVFPSDNAFIIEVVKGYKDLPDLKTAERYKRTIEEITKDYIDQSDKKLKDNLNSIDNTKKQVDESIAKGLNDIKDSGDTYINNIGISYSAAEKEFNKTVETMKNLIDTTGNSYIALIGSKKDQALKDIDGQVKSSTDKYLSDYSKKLNDKVDKAAGKDLSDNNFTNLYKNKLDSLDNTIDEKIVNKADKKELKEQIQEVRDLIFDNTVKYANDTVYILDTKVEGSEVKVVPKEIGKLVANDFLKVQVNSDKYRFRIKSTSKGIILFYSMTDEALRYAIHVYPNVKEYEINFGKKVTGEMIFTSVTMPEDKVSVVREEGFNVN
ncbi:MULTISPECIES: hypothetical protein [Anaerococcus]|uniref:hypothetical protein n=1 Tax=Anaerococcus TaxID=165779 RepID=UPI001D4F1462|nr:MULTISPECIES: hypothetical protein [Anaerococcus]MBS5989559.1 hypothetical protein [Anaerococcus hydrogenalis]MDU4026534.1 hypothetical protein [Anaerococcus sp.]